MEYNINYYTQVGSTNDTAKKLGAEGAPEGIVVSAYRQTKGRGRLGRAWVSRGGCYFSVILRPKFKIETAPQLTLAAALAVCNAVTNLTGVSCGIKWPNDILINNKKICGILTEFYIDFAVLGIGINVNTESFDDELEFKAASLYTETGKKYESDTVMRNVLDEFSTIYETFVQHGGFKPFVHDYKMLCLNLNKHVVVNQGGEMICFCADISDNGELLLLTEGGEMISINSGEVSVRGIDGYV